jgi:hypothetical protein
MNRSCACRPRQCGSPAKAKTKGHLGVVNCVRKLRLRTQSWILLDSKARWGKLRAYASRYGGIRGSKATTQFIKVPRKDGWHRLYRRGLIKNWTTGNRSNSPDH